jgi:type IV secretory pathway TrbL component
MKLEDILKNLNEEKSSFSNRDLDIDSDDLKEQIKLKKLESDRYSSDTRDRKWLAIWTATIVTLWLIAVLCILIFNEQKLICLSDTVLVTLLGTTTLNVLGLSFIVLRGHFNSTQKTV